jgi:L-asparagine transporter-like permease
MTQSLISIFNAVNFWQMIFAVSFMCTFIVFLSWIVTNKSFIKFMEKILPKNKTHEILYKIIVSFLLLAVIVIVLMMILSQLENATIYCQNCTIGGYV